MFREDQADGELLIEVGARLRGKRLQMNMPIKQLAEKCGVSVNVIQRAEMRGNCQMSTLLRMLRGLGALGQLDQFLPIAEISPIQLAKMRGKQRRRASGKR